MEVTVISTSPKKEKEALSTLGADHFVVSKDEAQMSVRLLAQSLAETFPVCTHLILVPDVCSRGTDTLRQWKGNVQVCLLAWHLTVRLNVYCAGCGKQL
jgi:hypothetical protein